MPKPGLIAAAFALIWVPAGEAQNAAPQESGPTIRATANEVALDLVVRDKRGRLVKNLKPGDLEIYEDGVRQEIRSLRLVSGEPPPVQPQPDWQEPGESRAGANHPAFPLPSLNLMCIVFHNLDPSTRKWAVDAAQDFIKTQLRPGTWVGVFNLDSRFTPLQAFTMNRNELLRAAASAFNGSSVDITRAAESVLNSTPNLQLYRRIRRCGRAFRRGARHIYDGIGRHGSHHRCGRGQWARRQLPARRPGQPAPAIHRREGARQMDQINLLIRQLAAFPGHKTVLLLSPGLHHQWRSRRFRRC